MSKVKFNKLLKQRIRKNAYKYLTEKKRTKGKEISYSRIKMAEYLLPENDLTIEQKRRIFAVRNKMVDIPNHFSSSKNNTLCVCGEKETLSHIYDCEILNETKRETLPYEKIYDGNVFEQTKILYKIEENLQVREKHSDNKIITKKYTKTEKRRKRKMNELPCDPIVDPLICKKLSIG